MVRPAPVVPFVRAAAATLALSIATPGLPLRAQPGARGAAPASPALETLLRQAATLPSGTYVITGSTVTATTAGDEAVIQADVLRGPGRTIRVPVALGAAVTGTAEVRLRLVDLPAPGGTAKIVADAAGSSKAGPLRLVHDFALAPGDYEIQAVIGHPRRAGDYVATLTKTRLTVPDVWQGTLAVTPVVVGDAVASMPPPATVAPFAFGRNVLQPAASGTFRQHSAINVGFRIFNWKAGDGAARDTAPDLTVDYLFYQQGARRLTFFNKLKQEHLNASTLGATFEAASGMVAAGMVVPLVSFPAGDFQLTVRVTDTRSKQSVERQVRFSVARPAL